MTNKKLKDLKKGDRIWCWHFDDTTPIYVDSAMRDGELMRLTISWDDSVYECFGPALGFTCVGYSRKFRQEIMFTCSYDLSHENMRRKERIKDLVPRLKDVIAKIEEI